MGPPIEGTKEALQELRRLGIRIVVYSVRLVDERAKKHIADWLRYWEVPYDELAITKPDADVYLDDRAFRFDTWAGFIALHRRADPSESAA